MTQTHQLGKLASQAPAMQAVFELVTRFAPTEVSITVLGETGTGKDVLAHVIHERSARARGPFVVFDCGAVAASLAESELLGHERGAFTGAVGAHAGAFERADGGTLFLDEIGELPLQLQPRLLRALEHRRVRRVGGTQYRPIDVRIVAATNRDLRADVGTGTFRRDLYFRLAAAVIPVPPLRNRLEDLPLLSRQLLRDLGRPDIVVSESALRELGAYSWPGNIRELKHALAFAATFVDAGEMCDEHVRRVVSRHDACFETGVEHLPLWGQRLDEIEKAAIQQTLDQADGNKVRAAQLLGIAVSTLYDKLKRYGLQDD